jgi:predicted nucleotide-binding protein
VLGALKGALALAKRQGQEKAQKPVEGTSRTTEGKPPSKVFVVHGHNKVLLEQCARFLEKLDLQPVILFEQPGKSQTIIEKLESNSDVRYAVVLLTPDDVGKAAGASGKPQPRARQNVILELGYFLAKLGRPNVAALHDESVELPSDYRGVEYIKVDAEGAWKLKLAREMRAADLPVDMNKAI